MMYKKIELDNEDTISITVTESKHFIRKDGRLFPDHLLYCEGAARPLTRGMIHLLCAILLPFAWWFLLIEANGNVVGIVAGSLYIGSNLLCYGTSALYHVGRWSVTTEILIQKIDHCGIAILSFGTMIPSATLLLDPITGNLFILLTGSLCLWTCYGIINQRPSTIKQILVAASCLPFLPICYYHMNRIEWICVFSTIIFQSIGVSIFISRSPDLYPKYFGYHELFHLFVVLAGLSVFLLNWSIIRRTCNPYSHHNDIIEVLFHLVEAFMTIT